MKYIKITVASNFGNIFSILFATIFLPFMPMLPLQILILNLVYDLTCISLPWDNVDNQQITKPLNFDSRSIKNFMLWFGPISTIFDLITFALLYLIIAPHVLGTTYHSLFLHDQITFIKIFQTGWFILSLFTQTLVIYILRSPRLPLIQTKPAPIVLLVTTLGLCIGTFITLSKFGVELEMINMPSEFYFYLILIISCYLVLTSFIKTKYLKYNNSLL